MTVDTYNALLASVVSLQTQVAVMSFQITALQNAALHVRDGSGNYQPVSRISFDSGSMSMMYSGGTDHCHVWVTGPPVDDPN